MERPLPTPCVPRLAASLVLPALLFFSGCYERVEKGDQPVYHFAWWMGPAIIAGAIAALPAGWFLRSVNKRMGYGLLFLGPFLLVAVVPAMYSNRVVVDDQHFECSYGMWFSPTVHSIRFDSLREIHIARVRGARGKVNVHLNCLTRSGETQTVHAGDLVKQALDEILERAAAHGVRVTEDPS